MLDYKDIRTNDEDFAELDYDIASGELLEGLSNACNDPTVNTLGYGE